MNYDFWRALDSYGVACGAHASGGITLQKITIPYAVNVLSGTSGVMHNRFSVGRANLTAVGMAAQIEI